eukprot:scaffold551_cov395-Prasinococcus_capsulatus_cf.AAC.20
MMPYVRQNNKAPLPSTLDSAMLHRFLTYVHSLNASHGFVWTVEKRKPGRLSGGVVHLGGLVAGEPPAQVVQLPLLNIGAESTNEDGSHFLLRTLHRVLTGVARAARKNPMGPATNLAEH